MRKVSVGEVYIVRIYYEDDPSQFKWRPVIVVDVEDESSPLIAIVTPTTGEPPQDPPTYHDQFKVPIEKWAEAGLHKKSYARTHKLYRIPVRALRDCKGKLDPSDLLNVLRKINENLSR